jgi:hypothetical protein
MRTAAKLLIGSGLGCCARADYEPKVERPIRRAGREHNDAYRMWGVLKAARARDEAARARRVGVAPPSE